MTKLAQNYPLLFAALLTLLTISLEAKAQLACEQLKQTIEEGQRLVIVGQKVINNYQKNPSPSIISAGQDLINRGQQLVNRARTQLAQCQKELRGNNQPQRQKTQETPKSTN